MEARKSTQRANAELVIESHLYHARKEKERGRKALNEKGAEYYMAFFAQRHLMAEQRERMLIVIANEIERMADEEVREYISKKQTALITYLSSIELDANPVQVWQHNAKIEMMGILSEIATEMSCKQD